ncbi:MAG: hypothetical protein DI536_23985 [Archangium gephyra]|uniref:Carboxypeptidase regulatory-like domain-containing protein n=1 Tax=Archangium gephyra TaxID=48 RepID=A0A2W5T4M6_9BACT|nr:MAG: hypothetical protein DI536_23985 [Archangium gephyra]
MAGGFALLVSCGAEPANCDVSTDFALGADEVRGPTMRPGANCLRCHSASGEAKNKPFSFGGTVFATGDATACEGVAGVTIRVTDAKGKTVSVVSNSVGNFWSIEPLETPYSMEAELEGRVLKMPVTAPTGGCALCHSWPDPVSASGRVRAP